MGETRSSLYLFDLIAGGTGVDGMFVESVRHVLIEVVHAFGHLLDCCTFSWRRKVAYLIHSIQFIDHLMRLLPNVTECGDCVELDLVRLLTCQRLRVERQQFRAFLPVQW